MTLNKNDQPLVADGGLQEKPVSDRDPYEVLDELMLVVEALCPVWPERPTFKGQYQFKI